MEGCDYCKNYRETPRGEEELKTLVSRVNRVKGQMEGIKAMLEENRYCGDILIQISAAESALRSIGYLVLEDSVVSYKCGEVFYGEGDSGIMYNDLDINIKWPFEKIGGIENMIISDKDKNLMSFKEYIKRVK